MDSSQYLRKIFDPTTLQAPVAKETTDITNNSFMANWNNSSGANDYELDLSTDAAFTSNIRAVKILADSILVDNLNSNTEYYYRVRAAFIGENPSGNSNVISVFTLPNAPILVSSLNDTTLSPPNVLFVW